VLVPVAVTDIRDHRYGTRGARAKSTAQARVASRRQEEHAAPPASAFHAVEPYVRLRERSPKYGIRGWAGSRCPASEKPPSPTWVNPSQHVRVHAGRQQRRHDVGFQRPVNERQCPDRPA